MSRVTATTKAAVPRTAALCLPAWKSKPNHLTINGSPIRLESRLSIEEKRGRVWKPQVPLAHLDPPAYLSLAPVSNRTRMFLFHDSTFYSGLTGLAEALKVCVHALSHLCTLTAHGTTHLFDFSSTDPPPLATA